MKVSKEHLEYIVDKLKSLIDLNLKEYELNNDLFRDVDEYLLKEVFNKPYMFKPDNEEEAKILFKYFNATSKNRLSFKMNQYKEHSQYYVYYESPHGYPGYFNAKTTSSSDMELRLKRYKLLDFRTAEREIIKYLSENESK